MTMTDFDTQTSIHLAGEEPLDAALDVIRPAVAILDEAGTIVRVNEPWRDLLGASGLELAAAGVGIEYLETGLIDVLEARDAVTVRVGLETVLRGRTERFQHSVCLHCLPTERWYDISVARFMTNGSVRVIVTHEDVSAIHLARETIDHLSQRLLKLQEEERQRIALELHDSTAQQLTAIGLHLMVLRQTIANDDDTRRTIDQVQESVDEAQREIRAFSYLLHPPYLGRDGLKKTLARFIAGYGERTRLRATMRVTDEVDTFMPEVQHGLLRIVQEALANAHRHASASEVRIEIRTTPKVLVLKVSDNGKGIVNRGDHEAADINPSGLGVGLGVGLGLAGMRARVHALSGALRVRSGPHGTTVAAEVPLDHCRSQCLPRVGHARKHVRVN
jgi:two-component system NarL family sensor kinase